MKASTVVCIPARYQSSRLPGKPLLEIAGKPLILWALESAAQLKAQQMVVATDDQRIVAVVEKAGYKAIMTASDHPTGTDRLAEVAELMNWSDDTIVVNYQGDEPMTPQANIEQLVQALIDSPQVSIATLYQSIESFEDFINPNHVKLITDENDLALYFSRTPIPYYREGFETQKLDTNISYKHHIGLYAYRAGFLKEFSKLSPSKLEQTESLEQLRALSHGYKIVAKKAIETMPHGIDTPEDVQNFERSFLKRS